MTIAAEPEAACSATDETPLIDSGKKKGLLPSGKGSIFSSAFNLANTVIGGGILGLPWAYKNAGVAIGTVLLIVTFILTNFSLRLLMVASRVSQRYTFRDVAEAAMGKPGVILTQVSLIVATFGCLVSYFIIVGDMISPVIGYYHGDYCDFIADRRFPIILSLLVIFPLSCLRNIDHLRYSSYFALVAVCFLVVMVVVQSGYSLAGGSFWDCDQGGCLEWGRLSVTIFRAVPIICFAFTSSMNLLPITAELQNPTKRRVSFVIHGALSLCLVVYFLVAAFGYMTFYETSKGNILLNYEVSDIVVTIGRMAVAFVVILSSPLMAHPCLRAVDSVLFPGREQSTKRHLLECFCVICGSFAISMVVDDVSFALGLTGASASTMIGFILPALLYLKVPRKQPLRRWKMVCAALVVIIGTVFSITSLTVTIIYQHEDEPPIPSMCNTTAYHPPSPSASATPTPLF